MGPNKMPSSNKNTLGLIITSTSSSAKDPGQLLKAALATCKEGAEVGIFLIGDGVYIATSNPKEDKATKALFDALKAGAKVFVSKDHFDAIGLPSARLPKGMQLLEQPYKNLVLKVMEDWEKVVVC
jgi:sulfur relay (sulfurtransferase) DsrF/TusC family protein